MAKTDIHEFLGELDAGIFENKLATALSEVAMGAITHDKAGKVVVEFAIKKMDSDQPAVQIQHKLSYVKPTKRGKSSEEDDTDTAPDGWIDINEKLPPTETEILGRCIINDKELIIIVSREVGDGEYWFSPVNFSGVCTDETVEVLHWQPLPKLPQA